MGVYIWIAHMLSQSLRQYPVPVVRLIVVDTEGRALILRRQDYTAGGGGWSLPGGKIEYGQTVEEAAARELEEETALRCTAKNFLFYQDSPPEKSGGMHCINFYFECVAAGSLNINDESSEFAWIAEGDLDRYDVVFRNDEGLMRYWAAM